MKTSDAGRLYANLGIKPPAEIAAPASEYIQGTTRKQVDGVVFRSTLEARIYQLLCLWRDAGIISGLEVQPKYLLAPKVTHFEGNKLKRPIGALTYRPDFRFERDGRQVVIEAKGYQTEAYRIREKLFRAKYPAIDFQVWTKETLKEKS
jgi:hypothetical protein